MIWPMKLCFRYNIQYILQVFAKINFSKILQFSRHVNLFLPHLTLKMASVGMLDLELVVSLEGMKSHRCWAWGELEFLYEIPCSGGVIIKSSSRASSASSERRGGIASFIRGGVVELEGIIRVIWILPNAFFSKECPDFHIRYFTRTWIQPTLKFSN